MPTLKPQQTVRRSHEQQVAFREARADLQRLILRHAPPAALDRLIDGYSSRLAGPDLAKLRFRAECARRVA